MRYAASRTGHSLNRTWAGEELNRTQVGGHPPNKEQQIQAPLNQGRVPRRGLAAGPTWSGLKPSWLMPSWKVHPRAIQERKRTGRRWCYEGVRFPWKAAAGPSAVRMRRARWFRKSSWRSTDGGGGWWTCGSLSVVRRWLCRLPLTLPALAVAGKGRDSLSGKAGQPPPVWRKGRLRTTGQKKAGNQGRRARDSTGTPGAGQHVQLETDCTGPLGA